jgi:putative membrane protein
MFKFILYLVLNVGVLFLVDYLLQNFTVSNLWSAIIFIIVLSILNWTLLPLLKLIAFPINFLTLGLFGSFLGLVMVILTTTIVKGIELSGDFGQKLVSALIISISFSLVQALVGSLTGKD